MGESAGVRQGGVIEHHLRNSVLPRINVTRRDVERYYGCQPGDERNAYERAYTQVLADPEFAGFDVRFSFAGRCRSTTARMRTKLGTML